jgi:anti-sigma factor (TIGR02949 family)
MILDAIRRLFGGGDRPRPPELSCHEALERVYELLDGELDPAEADRVDEHFRVCAACYPHLKLEECFRKRVRSALGETPVPDEVRTRVLELLAREEEAGAS